MDETYNQDLQGDAHSSQLDQLISNSKLIDYEVPIFGFVKNLYKIALDNSQGNDNFKYSLAALFDLAVSSLYLEKIVSKGWYSCSENPDDVRFVYPFVNTCPCCSLDNKFVFIKARKPESGSIGQVTSAILSAFLDLHVSRRTKGAGRIRIAGGSGLVDAVLEEGIDISLIEIKASPLIAFPIQAKGKTLTDLDENGNTVVVDIHTQITPTHSLDASFIIDQDLGIPIGATTEFVFGGHYARIIEWLNHERNFVDFVNSWTNTFMGYADPLARSSTYWMTNGCGTPSPRPVSWPTRSSGSGLESISDGKSSVGMDRTDDVKKGIYQVLKMSSAFKNSLSDDLVNVRRVHVALASNIHAVKHQESYIDPLKDLVWSRDGVFDSAIVKRGPLTTEIKSSDLFNLIDGLISFTMPYCRDDYLRVRFDF